LPPSTRVQAGDLALDRVIDAMPSLGLDLASIRDRLPQSLETLRQLLHEAAETPRCRAAAVAQAVHLAEGLSPRTELLNVWTEELKSQTNDGRLMPSLERRRRLYLRTRRELAEANLRLVVSIAKRYRNRGLPFADLIQEGQQRPDARGGQIRLPPRLQVGTYATWWVRQGITRALSDLSRTVRVPCHHLTLLRQIEQVSRELTLARGPGAEHGGDRGGAEHHAGTGVDAANGGPSNR